MKPNDRPQNPFKESAKRFTKNRSRRPSPEEAKKIFEKDAPPGSDQPAVLVPSIRLCFKPQVFPNSLSLFQDMGAPQCEFNLLRLYW